MDATLLKNKDGRWLYNGVVYKLSGYFDYLNIRVIERDSVFDIGSESFYINRASLSGDGIYVHSRKMVGILKQFGINPLESVTYPAGRHIFVFERVNTVDKNSIQKISLFDNESPSKQPILAIESYLKEHKFVPLLINQEELHHLLTNKKTFPKSEMTAEWFTKHIKTKFGTGGITMNSRELNEDKANDQLTAIDLDIQSVSRQRIEYQKLALRKGGHVEIAYGNEQYLVPKLPLIALKSKINENTKEYSTGLYTWFFDGDRGKFESILIRDLLLGSNIPDELIVTKADDIIIALKNTELA